MFLMRRDSTQLIRRLLAIVGIAVLATKPAFAAEADLSDLESALSKEILPRGLALEEVQAFCEARVPGVPRAASRDEWDRLAATMRKDVLDRIIFRGRAQRWREAPAKVEWLETIPG